MRKLCSIVILSVLAIVLLITVGSVFQVDESDVPSFLYEVPSEDLQVEEDNAEELVNDNAYNKYSIADISDSYSNGSALSSCYKDDSNSSETSIVKYTSQKIDLMSEADSLSFIIGTIPIGAPVQLYEDCDCKWVCVAYNNHYGYVRSADLVGKEKEVIQKSNSRFSFDQNGSDSPESAFDNNHYHGANEENDAVNSAPKGATALCNDGTYSFSRHRRGTCSWHGGVRKWLK